MFKFPIGAMLESFRLPTDQALERAAEIGADGIQVYTTKGERAPENMNAAARRSISAYRNRRYTRTWRSGSNTQIARCFTP